MLLSEVSRSMVLKRSHFVLPAPFSSCSLHLSHSQHCQQHKRSPRRQRPHTMQRHLYPTLWHSPSLHDSNVLFHLCIRNHTTPAPALALQVLCCLSFSPFRPPPMQQAVPSFRSERALLTVVRGGRVLFIIDKLKVSIAMKDLATALSLSALRKLKQRSRATRGFSLRGLFLRLTSFML
ncbi:hypothetical protein F5883DRAFT_560106, partial [Diaporthe sp. PMI_573]